MTKKVYKQKYFFVITNKLNWEILTKNLVIFKRYYEVKDEKALIFSVFNKKSNFYGVEFIKSEYRGALPKTGGGGAWTVCTFKGGDLSRKR